MKRCRSMNELDGDRYHGDERTGVLAFHPSLNRSSCEIGHNSAYGIGVMKFWRKNVRSLSLFVLAFLCLNIGGVLCLARCARPASSMAEHCPMKAHSDHCNRTKESQKTGTENIRAEAHRATCCSLPVSFFVAPVEKRVSFTFDVVESPVVVTRAFESPETFKTGPLVYVLYRPPPLDLRGNRLRNCVIRI